MHDIFTSELKAIIEFLSGLTIFLFSIKLISTTMEENLSFKAKNIVNKLTYNKIYGVCIGFFLTSLMQSSSLTTILILTLAHSKIITIKKSIPIIIGANIGTTITSQITSFDIDNILPYILILGIVLFMYSESHKVKLISLFILCFSLIFIGIELMGSSIESIRTSPKLSIYISYIYDNRLKAILFGTIFSALIHSSSTSVVLLQIMSNSGVIPIKTAIYVLLGLNLGTCIDVVIAGFTTNIYGKRVAVAHILFNLIGIFIFIFIGDILLKIVVNLSANNIPRQIANAHTIFNITTALLILPFSDKLANLSSKAIKDH